MNFMTIIILNMNNSFTDYELQIISPNRDDVLLLMNQLNTHNLSHCLPEICRWASPEDLDSENVTMVGAFIDNKLCSIGAVEIYKNYCEVKRMYTDDKSRGLGLARAILNELIRIGKEFGITVFKLETSTQFISAMKLYRSAGFTVCKPFGQHVEKPVNTYMEKTVE